MGREDDDEVWDLVECDLVECDLVERETANLVGFAVCSRRLVRVGFAFVVRMRLALALELDFGLAVRTGLAFVVRVRVCFPVAAALRVVLRVGVAAFVLLALLVTCACAVLLLTLFSVEDRAPVLDAPFGTCVGATERPVLIGKDDEPLLSATFVVVERSEEVLESVSPLVIPKVEVGELIFVLEEEEDAVLVLVKLALLVEEVELEAIVVLVIVCEIVVEMLSSEVLVLVMLEVVVEDEVEIGAAVTRTASTIASSTARCQCETIILIRASTFRIFLNKDYGTAFVQDIRCGRPGNNLKKRVKKR